MGRARRPERCVRVAGAARTVQSAAPAPRASAARRREFPFWPTQFPVSEGHTAIAGRFEPRLGWDMATRSEMHVIAIVPMSTQRARSVAILGDHFGPYADHKADPWQTQEVSHRGRTPRRRPPAQSEALPRPPRSPLRAAGEGLQEKACAHQGKAEGTYSGDVKTPAPVFRGRGARGRVDAIEVAGAERRDIRFASTHETRRTSGSSGAGSPL